MAGYMEGGLKQKYFVFKNRDGEPVLPDPEAEYFVLRLDTDLHARKALKAYAESVRKDNPQFANDLERWLQDLKTWKEAD